MTKKILIISSLVLSLSACSQKADIDNLDLSAVKFNASISGGAQSKTKLVNLGALSGQAFEAGDKFFIGINNNPAGAENFSESSCLRTISVNAGPTFVPDTPVYWDDLGGRLTNVFVWGVYTHGATTPTITKSGAFTWTATADQSADDNYKKLDLLYSNNKTSLVYTPDATKPAVRDIANLTFTHAMSRIIINLKNGDGFAVADFTNATSTLKNQYTTVNVNLLSSDTVKTDVSKISDIKMRKTTSAAGFAASFDAIVAPSKKYAVGDVIAEITVNGNTYKLTASSDFVTKIGEDGLLKNNYYTFNITLGKSGIQFAATVTDWSTGYETASSTSETAQIVIDAVDKGSDLSGTDKKAFTNSFALYQSHDGNNYDANSSTAGVQSSTVCTNNDGTMTYSNPIYWQSSSDNNYFRGFYPDNSAFTQSGTNTTTPVNAGDVDYQWGTSGDELISPTSKNVNMLFEHKTSSIIVNLKTVEGAAAVNLAGATVEIVNTIKSGSIDLHSGNLVLGTTREDYTLKYISVESGVYKHTTYALPQFLNGADGVVTDGNQLVSDDAFVKITVNPTDASSKNVYYLKLNTALQSGTAIDKWEASKTYTYNITLKKTDVKFAAQITDWVSGFNSDNINIGL